MTYTEIIEEIRTQIAHQFPYVTVTVDEHAETGDTFILIDDATTYDSPSFRRLRAGILEDIVWPHGLTNLHLACNDRAGEAEDYEAHVQLMAVTFSTESNANERLHYEFGYHMEDVYRVRFPANALPGSMDSLEQIA